MRIVGKRKYPLLTYSASAESLVQGCRFNDEIHRLPTGNLTFILKGVYHFKSHEDANRHALDCLAAGMERIALDRSI
jgi:hypothetical protein